MKIEFIRARDLLDAWFHCVYSIFDKGYEYTIDRGSFKGQKRIEYDYIVVHIAHPGTRPLIQDIPPGCNVPPPTSMEYVEQYLEKLITSRKMSTRLKPTGRISKNRLTKILRKNLLKRFQPTKLATRKNPTQLLAPLLTGTNSMKSKKASMLPSAMALKSCVAANRRDSVTIRRC
jgi:hypothetical protein